MIAASINIFVEMFNPARLLGPIFDKELRVSSRRRKNYVLRFIYISFLTIFMVLAWLEGVQYIGSSALNLVSRMAGAGKNIIVMIVWFQFIVTQCIAVIILSTSISDEIYNRTLGVLMSTPITSFQIVMGKLFSKLLQVILLLAISLPLLAIVRVFGGVPWDYVISSLCITLTTVIFFGSVSLFFSIFSRKSYVVIILTALTLGILFGLLLFFFMVLFGFFSWGRQTDAPIVVLFHLNPYMLLALSTDIMQNPRLTGRISFSWPIHCGFMLAASSVVLFVCVRLVRKVALAQAAGYSNFLSRLWHLHKAASAKDPVPEKSGGKIRRVKGPPVVWKELTSRLSGREKLFVGTIIAVELIMIVAMYLFPVVSDFFGLEETHTVYFTIFMGLGLLSVIIFPATSIASEKEARTWPVLLTTTLTEWQILLGKWVGVLRRTIPAWMLLFIYLIPFLGIWGNNLDDFISMIILVAGMTIFLCGTGFYFSSRFKRSNTAVLTNFILAAIVWGIIPYLMLLFMETLRMGRDIRRMFEDFMNVAPFMQVIEILSNHGQAISVRFVYVYIILGLVFAWLAKRRLRREIF